jgi:hypothetical protein
MPPDEPPDEPPKRFIDMDSVAPPVLTTPCGPYTSTVVPYPSWPLLL